MKKVDKNNQYKVRGFCLEDAEELSLMIRHDIMTVNTEDPQWERDYLYNFYTPENIIKNAHTGHTFVIEDRDTHEIVATGTIKENSPAREGAIGESEISACFVKSVKLRHGLGTLLFDTIENDSYFLSAKRVWLTTSVYASSFYERRGYKYTFGHLKRNEDKLIEMEKFPRH